MAYLRVNGYAAEVERTYFHHESTAYEKEMFHHMICARALGISMIRPGVPCDELDGAVQDYLKGKGCRAVTRYPDTLDDLVLNAFKPLARIKGRMIRAALGITAGQV